MLICGIDPGSRIMGIALLERENKNLKLIHTENIIVKKKDFIDKTKVILSRLEEICKSYKIDIAAIEEGYLGKNVYSMDLLSKIRGVITGFFVLKGIDLIFFSPAKIKKSITGNGNASKEQVLRSLKLLLNLDSDISYDESDAISVAYTYAIYNGGLSDRRN